VEFDVTTSVAVMALVPAGSRAPVAPLVGMSTHALVVDDDNAVWSWGLNHAGQLGGGPGGARNLPATILGLSGAISVEAGDGFSVVLKGDGTVHAWGANFAGQLGPRAESVPLDQPAKVLGLGCIEKIAVGGTAATVLALGRDGMLYSWGRNADGQAGQGSADPSVVPGPIPMVTDPRDFDISNHGLAVLAGGEVMAWGRNDRGQLGNGTFVSANEPVPVTGLDDEDIVAVAAGGAFSLALSAGGTVWAWGANESGQLGDGTFFDRAEPFAVMEDVIAIAASGRTALAVDVFGDVWTWGAGESGQRGDGTFAPVQALPVLVGGFASAVVDLDGGVDAFILTLGDGAVYTWGRNDVGQLGDGTFFNRSTPVEIGSR
jgi:alpha-tubulin suppressor-like RCC1 family protein